MIYFPLIVLAALGLASATVTMAAPFSVAAVQYQVVNISAGSGADTVLTNAAGFAYVASKTVAVHPDLSLIAFPEFALMGNNYSFSAGGFCSASAPESSGLFDYCFAVPDPGQDIDCADMSNPLAVVACGAGATAYANVVVSINLCEKTHVKRSMSREEGETAQKTTSTWWLYNSQVFVHGRRIVSVYRKTHPFYTSCFATPAVQYDIMNLSSRAADPSSPTTKLGCFTCFDIMFPQPKDGLVERGVRLFSYSSSIPVVGQSVVKLFSWTSNSTMVSANDALGESGIFSRGSTLASCAKGDKQALRSGGTVQTRLGELSIAYCIAHATIDE